MGKLARISVPRDCPERMSSRPATASARSSIPRNPSAVDWSLLFCKQVVSIPTQLSLTDNSSVEAKLRKVIKTFWAVRGAPHSRAPPGGSENMLFRRRATIVSVKFQNRSAPQPSLQRDLYNDLHTSAWLRPVPNHQATTGAAQTTGHARA